MYAFIAYTWYRRTKNKDVSGASEFVTARGTAVGVHTTQGHVVGRRSCFFCHLGAHALCCGAFFAKLPPACLGHNSTRTHDPMLWNVRTMCLVMLMHMPAVSMASHGSVFCVSRGRLVPCDAISIRCLHGGQTLQQCLADVVVRTLV